MRITGNRMIELAAAATSTSQQRVADASAEVSSGLRVDRPSDDPTAWTAGERTKLARSLAQGVVAGTAASRDRLQQTDGALAAIGEAVSQVRELAVQGASASYNASDRAEIAVQVRALFASALGAANTQSADGEFLLAGSSSLVAPFDPAGNYVGDATAREIPTGTNVSSLAAIAGSELTSSAGVDVLPLLGRVADALAANDTTALATTLGELATAVQQVGLARTRTGGAMNVLDATSFAHAQLEENLAGEIARHVEADSIGAATALAKASQSLEVSRAISSHVIGLLDPRST